MPAYSTVSGKLLEVIWGIFYVSMGTALDGGFLFEIGSITVPLKYDWMEVQGIMQKIEGVGRLFL